MRDLPTGWPEPSDPDQITPTVYLHLIDATWPAATDTTPAGWVELTGWSTAADLTGTLLPNQIIAPSGFSVSTAEASFTTPGALLAPWKPSAEEGVRLVPFAELIASYDGPEGATAFRLGNPFRLDPVSGKVSDRSISVSLVEDWVALDRPNTVHQHETGIADPLDHPYDSAEIVRQIAESAGLAHDVPDFGNIITSIYFPGDRTARQCLTDVLAANLAVGRIDSDGELAVLSFQQVSGYGDTVDELDVLDEFTDLEWTIDPGEVFDRVEVTYSPPDYAYFGHDPLDSYIIWTSPTKAALAPGASVSYEFDPGVAVEAILDEGRPVVEGNPVADGSGDDRNLVTAFEPLSTGRWRFTLKNLYASDTYRTVEESGEPVASYMLDRWKDTVSDDSGRVLSWGATADDALNPLSVSLGKLIQRDEDAQLTLDRIVSRVSKPAIRLTSVNVVPNLGREIGDLVHVDFAEEGLVSKALVLSVKNTGDPGKVTQSLDLALLSPLIKDFNDAWDAAQPGATIADFNTKWAGKTIADFNNAPLDT